MNYSYRAVLVHTLKQGKVSPAPFGDCLLDVLSYKDVRGRVAIKQDIPNDAIVIQSADESKVSELRKGGWEICLLQHNTCCPVLYMPVRVRDTLPPEVASRGVNTGVCVLVESADRALLLSCRAAHMRTFAGAWVPPGGHIESGETIAEAGLRELWEETGLDLRSRGLAAHTLGLWESVYPHLLSAGDPRRHHLVVYLHVALPETAEQLLPALKLDKEEVQAATFLTESFIASVVSDTGSLQQGPTDAYHLLVVDEQHESGQRVVQVEAGAVYQRATACRTPSFQSERLTFGTHFAMERWLQRVRAHSAL